MTDLITRAISAVAPKSDVSAWSAALAPFMAASGITTPRRVAAFIGQVAWESTKFSTLEENLNYSASRLPVVWPSRFPNLNVARLYEHNPEQLANLVYADRMGNGTSFSGDGYRFRGAGLIQLTGRENQTKFATAAKLPVATIGDYLRTPKGAAQSAVWFWQSKNLNKLADGWRLTDITKVINGGTDGLSQRTAFCEAALKACSGTAPAPVKPEMSPDELMNIYNPTVE